jgi:hypothetical protein
MIGSFGGRKLIWGLNLVQDIVGNFGASILNLVQDIVGNFGASMLNLVQDIVGNFGASMQTSCE